MAQSQAESTRDTYNYGQYINQLLTNTIKVIREFERIQKKICRHKMSIMFNEICIYIYIYIHGNNLDMYPATTCDCNGKFQSLRGSRIHKVRWCKQRNSPAGECKSNDGPMNQVYPHSIHEPIAEPQ